MSSSIFNFETIRKAAGLPARVWTWHGILLASAFLCLSISSLLLESLHLDVPQKVKNMEGLEEARVLILGNSQALSIRETDLGIPAKNFALGGMGYVLQEGLFRSIAPRMKQLRLLLIGFDPIEFYIPYNERNRDYRDLVNWGLDLDHLPNLSFWDRWVFHLRFHRLSKPLLVGPKLTVENFSRVEWRRILDHLVKPVFSEHRLPPPNQVLVSNFVLPPRKEPVTERKAIAKAAFYQKAYKSESFLEANRESFFRILRACQERGIDVLLLKPPVHPAFLNKMNEKWGDTMDEILAEAKKRFGKTLSLEVVDPGTWESEDLWDPNHLSVSGSRKYTELLRALLVERLEKKSSEEATVD